MNGGFILIGRYHLIEENVGDVMVWFSPAVAFKPASRR
jgi:hypothetical protein